MFANGGWLVTPHLAAGDIDWLSPEHRTKVAIQPSTLQTIREGLRKVVEAGTGAGLNGPASLQRPERLERWRTAPGPDHAWFGCYALIPTARSWWCLCPEHPWRRIRSRSSMAKKVLVRERTNRCESIISMHLFFLSIPERMVCWNQMFSWLLVL